MRDAKIIIVLATKNIEDSAWVNFEVGLGYPLVLPVVFGELSDKVSYIKSKQGVIINYREIEKSVLDLAKSVLDDLGLSKDKDEIKVLPSFKKLTNFISTMPKKSKPTKTTAVWG